MSLKDSYKDMELYLQQVSVEIMRVFEEWNMAYGLKTHDGEIISPRKAIMIDSNGNLPKNGENKSSDLNEWLPDCNNCNKNFSSINETEASIANLLNSENCALNRCDPFIEACRSRDILEQLSADIAACENAKDNLHAKSTLCWRCHRDFRIDYSPVVPMLKKVAVKVNKQTCSQLDRRLAEIEATEACKWLRAAGFPQYAQMYEEMQFPVDLTTVQHDHPLLEPAVLQSLFRRLHILNRCANVCQQQQPCTNTEDSEDEQCTLSDNWTYQSDSRRWSRNHENISLASPKKTEDKDKVSVEDSGSDYSSSNITSPPREKSPIKLTPDRKLLNRTASTKFRYPKEGDLVSDIVCSISNIPDVFLKRLGSIKLTEESPIRRVRHLSTSLERDEDTPTHKSRSETKKAAYDKDCVPWSSVQNIEAVPKKVVEAEGEGQPINNLSCTQLQILRKLALLKLTAHIEKYCPSHRTGWNWDLPKFIKKIRTSAYKENPLLNLSLTAVLQKTGQPLPKGIQEALEWLYLNGSDQIGIFRKPGVRSRIQSLRTLVETQGENINFNDQQPYDVADMIKQYFRELPEAVLTNKLSETFILIFQYVPPYLRKEAILCALLLMPDEHRQVLQALLYFLLRISKYSDVNQMNDNNLAICFVPALFQYSSHSSFYRQNLNSSNSRELEDVKAAQECLLFMLTNNKDIFNVPKEFFGQCKLTDGNDSAVVQLSELGASLEGGWQGYMHECHMALLKEIREKNRGWIGVSTYHSKVELSYKKVMDGHPLRLWKVSADVEAPPTEVMHRILRERHLWDDDLQSAKIIAQMNKHSEVFHYVCRNITPLPYVDYCVIRTWNTDLPRGTCVIVETSVEYPDTPNIPNTIRGITLASRYLIEPGGSGRSRLIHLSRVDMRGRMPEWYQKNFGHICALHVARIQDSFHQTTPGPESKV